MKAPPRRWLHGLLLAIGVALLTVLFVQLGPARILERLAAVGWNFPVIVLIFAGHEAARALALGRCLKETERPPVVRLLRLQLIGEAVRTLTQAGQAGSEPVRAWLLAREGVAATRAYGAAISEVIANSTASALVTVLTLTYASAAGMLTGALALFAGLAIAVCGGFVLVIAVALIRRAYVISWLLGLLPLLPLIGRYLRTNQVTIRHIEDAVLHVLRDDKAVLVEVVLLEIVAQFLLVVETYWAITAMEIELSVLNAVLVEAFVKLVNTVQFAGVTEAGYAYLFGALGMPAAAGFAVSFLQRLRSLTLVGVALLLVVRRTGSRLSVFTAPPALGDGPWAVPCGEGGDDERTP